ncbi:class I SAM-dependent methyltransferase [Streptomyces sp. NBC_00572]|uniref:class I SAM-dependent methyltransferase n=1 Tax=Streptomyces sp. NBC_00572 TaxID=2903664 RepID=UPI0022505B48|nr:methyltransferase domain-containing protein [Streptomyces sp. NBC_00572]MCX4984561.1 class I SAM-dependent methyltransferase [Streptomyces sp. NBC_00572]
MAETVLDYEAEAAHYDRTRGGVPRAGAAAEAVLRLVPPGARTLLDLACGTGLVTERLTRPGLRVYGADAAQAMLRVADGRVPGRVVRSDARRLPLPDASVDAVGAVWLLHLVPFAAEIVAEAARVLRPGGVLVATVDKDAAHDVGSDIDEILRPHRSAAAASDRADLITGHAAAHGLEPAPGTHFTGYGQGATPRDTVRKLRVGHFASWFPGDPATAETLTAALAVLPDQDRPRAEPRYRLACFVRRG